MDEGWGGEGEFLDGDGHGGGSRRDGRWDDGLGELAGCLARDAQPGHLGVDHTEFGFGCIVHCMYVGTRIKDV